MDLSGAFLGLILLLPVHMIIAIILTLEDPKGPIFFFLTPVKMEKSLFKKRMGDFWRDNLICPSINS
ncbi:hypothetical protein AN960_00340 [Bacillus sp. FJAT-25509]|nr:sugar transferase [Bacillus sp. FJAT-25509]KQL42446.1 hypothetical protein AN960_00340 [Bacillus sp. FJAT-25509]